MLRSLVITGAVGLSLGVLHYQADAQSSGESLPAPKYEVDPWWPKTLPGKWVFARASGICIDSKDHVFVVNEGGLIPNTRHTAEVAPPIMEFDPAGNLLNSWGDREVLPDHPHGCYFDTHGNIWFAGNQDAIVQGWTSDGKTLLLQIGKKKQFDTDDGTAKGKALNAGHTKLNEPSGVAVDPANGDIYVSDGYGNSRVVVFDSKGNFLRQWGHAGTMEEAKAGIGGAFLKVLHCLAMGNDGLIYVCDREGYRIQVFDKMGKLVRNIPIGMPNDPPMPFQLISWISFSPDKDQKYIFAAAGLSGNVRILDRKTGKILSVLGREGGQTGEIGSAHTIAVDSKMTLYVADITRQRLVTFRHVK
jgi:DNA-binding beta-propeller fold protein YncE